MRKTLTTAALVLALTGHAWAGIMHTPNSPQPQPTPTPESTTQEPANGVTLNGDTQFPGMSESLTQIALELLAVLPSIL
jgi:hypothetical protein